MITAIVFLMHEVINAKIEFIYNLHELLRATLTRLRTSTTTALVYLA